MNYTIESREGLKVTVSDLGAEMIGIRLEETEYLWQANPAYWNEHTPVLFPYVGRLTDGKYRIGNREYQMKIHGFASLSTFEAEKRSGSCIAFTLKDSPETMMMYPFRFLFRVIYTVEGHSLKIRYEVENPGQASAEDILGGSSIPQSSGTSEGMLYFGIGGHPGLNVPLEDGLSFDDYYLEFGDRCDSERIQFTPACFLAGRQDPFVLEDGRILRLRHSLFDEDAIVLQNMADSVSIRSDKGQRSVTVRYPGLPYLGIWHMPKTDAPYVAIEPWGSLPSRQDVVEDLRFKPDLIRLENGGRWNTEWSITVS